MNRLEIALAAGFAAPGVALLTFMFTGQHHADEPPQPVPVTVRQVPTPVVPPAVPDRAVEA